MKLTTGNAMQDADVRLPVSPQAGFSLAALLAVLVAVLLFGLLMLTPQPARAADMTINEHARTGLPLHGAHSRVSCDRCHANNLFQGTPNQCEACHVAGSPTGASFKPANHVPTQDRCDSCHNDNLWAGARFKHQGVFPGSCQTCHNGSMASGKPARHVVTGASCDSCHRTVSWTPASFNHSNVTAGSCASCHNGSTAAGKPANHVVTTQSCDVCHRTNAWLPAGFSHNGVLPGTCVSCHNGSTAEGKPASHLPTNQSCDVCHRTTAWVPATFSHSSVTPGTCNSCHNGSQATGRGPNHFVTTRSCDVCHRTTAWTPTLTYSHSSPYYKAHRSSVICTDCHTTNNEVIAWKFGAYAPDCAGCHAGDFKAGEHKKVDTPKILYTVGELKNCSGSCHEYTDGTFTQIRRSRSGEHHATDGDF
ncbi:hypothetical protein HPT27_09515 [Permianibacter sp. IMCC34836]|uniref:cytochrome c3 family protein n=1 Tax=Permianibacter fluminis TaxID=2738515 RepID=UPI0015570D81|nr:cytochrome c3 family protein [Permianibacter fluminis]NQD37264.1 hypothetical protein [Permianibacter fluminis]